MNYVPHSADIRTLILSILFTLDGAQ